MCRKLSINFPKNLKYFAFYSNKTLYLSSTHPQARKRAKKIIAQNVWAFLGGDHVHNSSDFSCGTHSSLFHDRLANKGGHR
jgi:hypothetical protein